MSETPLFIRIARPTYGRWLLYHHQVRTAGYEMIPKQGPFLILANHTHTYDPFFISSSLKIHVRWVAGAYLFKNQFIKLLLQKWIGGIAKQQGRSDFQTIRDISAAFKQNQVVGLFPEGTRTWDGEPLGFELATAKLVRMFGVPVVLMHIEGGYAQRPRWAIHLRKGPITLRVIQVLQPGQLKQLSVKQVHQQLTELLGFSHHRWQKQQQIPYISRGNAEGLEKLLYQCPSCNSRSTLVTEGHEIRCTACDLTCVLDPYDHLLVTRGTALGFSSVAQWHTWEQQQLCATDATGELFPPDQGVLLQQGVGKKLVTISRDFTVALEADRMVITMKTTVPEHLNNPLIFTFEHMQSMIINAKSTIELYHADQLWRIRIIGNRSIVKYVEYYRSCRKDATMPAAGQEVP